jgi:hypothetical protein
MSGVLTRPRRERGQVASTRDRDDVLALGYANSSRLTAKACPVGGATENLNVHHFDANPSDSALATAPLRADQAGFTTRSPKDDDRELGGRLLLLGKAALLAHRLARPLAAESDEMEQRPCAR